MKTPLRLRFSVSHAGLFLEQREAFDHELKYDRIALDTEDTEAVRELVNNLVDEIHRLQMEVSA